ncbi:unnamed protein product [Dicrocoelium dendriticum]|nr:unnamed protein product [Dicrocoelium dendriticum]
MNLCGRFHVKSTYIKAAKDAWVVCDVRLLTDDVDTFLCIKSVSQGSLATDDEKSSVPTDGEAKFRNGVDQKPKNSGFTALCNLSEYKSCSVRTVRVNERDSFAIRLIPSGVIGNKQLLIASTDEQEITSWLALCKASIGKKSKAFHSSRDNFSTAGTLSKAGSFVSLKPSNTSMDADFDEALLDNEVYEAYTSEDKIPALLEEAGDWMKLHLSQPECYLRLTEERLEVLDPISEKPVQWFPYLLIRRFGAANGVLRVDAGRRCSTGDGRFFFRCNPPNGQPVDVLVTQIRQLALEAKQKMKHSQLASSNLELNGKHSNANCAALTSSATLGHRTRCVTDSDLDPPSIGTLPRFRSRRQNSLMTYTNGHSTGSTANSNHSASPEPGREVAEKGKDSPTQPTEAKETEVVTATPGRAQTIRTADLSDLSNLYDNLPRPPRKPSAARLPGAVNVLPLPVRAKSKSQSATGESRSESRLSSPQSENSVESTAPISTSQASSGTGKRDHVSTPLKAEFDEDLPPGPPPPPPLPTLMNGTTHSSNKDSRPDIMRPKSLPVAEVKECGAPLNRWKHPAPPPMPVTESASLQSPVTTAATVSTAATTSTSTLSPYVISTTPTAAMRVPPFTAPKPYVPQTSAAARLRSRMSNTKVDDRTSSPMEKFPMPLSSILSTKVSSTTMYLRGLSPTASEESSSYTHVKINPTAGVAAMVSRINSDWKSNTGLMKSPSLPSEQVDPQNDDPKNYLNELDNVIKELCKANEAAVQATREAARRRHEIGWPMHYENALHEQTNKI